MRTTLLLLAVAAPLLFSGCAESDTAAARSAPDQRVPPGWRHPELERRIRKTTTPVVPPNPQPKAAKEAHR